MKSLSLLALGWFALNLHAAPARNTDQLRNEAASLIPAFQQQRHRHRRGLPGVPRPGHQA